MTIELHGISDAGGRQHLTELVQDQFARRLFERDATLWGEAAEAEAAVRLGWTDVSGLGELIEEIATLRAELNARGINRVVLCGMGGSSLAPAVIRRWAGVDIEIVDSTHPDVMRRALGADLNRTVVVVSSKSGGTIETRSHRAAFTAAFEAAGFNPADHIVIVTDPGSPLEVEARAAGLRVFLADPNVGGRFSALTAFGLVPSGLAGADLHALLNDASAAREELRVDSASNPALQLAAWLAAGLPASPVLGVLQGDDAQWDLGDWIEQLIAESTGKNGLGVLPIALADAAPEVRATPANMRLVRVCSLTADDADDRIVEVCAPLGAQLLLWETATAALGRLLGIDPFNQPDVESAKIAAREQLDQAAVPAPARALIGFPGVSVLERRDEISVLVPGTPPSTPADLVARLRDMVTPDGYVSIQAYLDPEGPYASALEELRDALATYLGVPVALGWGPRYLHSTGQLHKGGPALGTFVQLLDSPSAPLEIPGTQNDFNTLIAAQARGAREVLGARGRPVLALECDDPGEAARRLVTALRA